MTRPKLRTHKHKRSDPNGPSVGRQSKALWDVQMKNIELAKHNAALSMHISTLQDQLLQKSEERIRADEERIKTECKLMEAMSALDVIKVEVGKRIPVLQAVADHLMDTADLFNELLSLDYGEILVERIKMGRSISRSCTTNKPKMQLEPIVEKSIEDENE